MKVPKPRKLPSGSWFIRLRLGGEDIAITRSTAKECATAAELIKAEYRSGKRAANAADSLTLGEAIDAYIEGKNNTLSPSTIRGYKTIRNSYLQGYMGKKLKSIDNWQAIMNAEAKTRAPKTVKNTWRFICSVLRENGISPPRVVLPQIAANEHPWLEPEQIRVFVAALAEQPHQIAALLALHGLRRSEIMALTWDKIDLKKNIIRISGAAVFDENQKLVQKATNKNHTSARSVPIMIPELKAALEAVPDKKGNLVTCNPNTIWARVNRTCEANGLPKVGVHGLRHSFASLAYHLGWSERQTMEIGGWADTQTMHKIYTHLSRADRMKAQNTMADFYSGGAT